MPINQTFDLLIIGGGINGSGIACDAAGRGLKVLLVEAGDLAGATSSASSKLIHGGLRYLEHYEFRLVREALAEREVMLAKAPHIVWPLRFVLPHAPSQRPRWMIRAGLFLYDHLARRRAIKGSGAIDLTRSSHAGVLRPDIRRGFTYWDCWVDDARLVVLNARAAANAGAKILTRTRLLQAKPAGTHWQATIKSSETGETHAIAARGIVNAAGPWTGDVLGRIDRGQAGEPLADAALRLVKGSHIVVPRFTQGEDAFILQNADGRVVFVLPYEGRFSLIGTTDEPFTGDPSRVAISQSEIAYLLSSVAQAFTSPPAATAIVWSYAGVRPLYDDDPAKSAKAVTRDYRLDLRTIDGAGPLLTVFGGKITTYRHLAEKVLEKLSPTFPHMGPSWTATKPLPGGDIAGGDFAAFVTDLQRMRPNLDARLLHALARRHGTLTEEVLGDAADMGALGRHIGHTLYEREVAHFRENEWAKTPEDVLWRRTKAGLHIAPGALREAELSLALMV